MSEPEDKRELSGLARSIDALFKGPVPGRQAPADSAAAPLEQASAPESPASDQAPEVASNEGDFGFDAAAPTTWPRPPAEPRPVEPAAWGPVLQDERRSWGGPGVDVGTDELDGPTWGEEQQELEEAPRPGPDPEAFARALEGFLAGTPGSAAKVEELAGSLADRLALDPLADAVELLAREAGDPPDPTLLDMASTIINPAVASRIVQRIGRERDDARKAEYTVLCQRLGEIMAKAFRGALTGATDSDARRTYYDVLIAMGDTSRPIIEGMVNDENTLLVRSAVAILGEMGGLNALELVTSVLAHPDARVRREALLSLAKLGDEESGALVLGFLDDPDPEVRVAAATAAGELRVDRALRPLLALLESEGDAESALPFIRALGQLGDPGAVPAIEKHAVKTLFSKPRTEMRVAAYRALHQIGTPHARDLVQQALSDKEPGVRAAVRGIVGSSAAP